MVGDAEDKEVNYKDEIVFHLRTMSNRRAMG